MQTKDYSFHQDIFERHLKAINNIKFTHREIDIIAFLVSGRAIKIIATFFSISPKTVDNHLRNVMHKLECHSRDAIVDFIEKSSYFFWVKKYYVSLLLEASFKKSLKKISTLVTGKPLVCFVIWWADPHLKTWHVEQLKSHLTLSGIKTFNEDFESNRDLNHFIHNVNAQNSSQAIAIVPDLEAVNTFAKEITELGFTRQQLKADFTFLCVSTTSSSRTSEELGDGSTIDCVDLKNYYDAVFFLLKKMALLEDLEKIQEEFNKQIELLDPELCESGFSNALELVLSQIFS